jgi:hypothetical protein
VSRQPVDVQRRRDSDPVDAAGEQGRCRGRHVAEIPDHVERFVAIDPGCHDDRRPPTGGESQPAAAQQFKASFPSSNAPPVDGDPRRRN